MRHRIDLFEESGYLNMRGILRSGIPFIFVVGGRGIGKTYGALKYVLENDIFFMFMRRTQSQTDLINKPEFSPFKVLNSDLKKDFRPRSISKYNSALVEYIDGEPSEKVVGYTCALSTISNMRGFDAQDVELLIWDEFIPEKHDRSIKNEGSAFLNAYETLNRNREVQGRPPLQVICLANANDLGNAVFVELGLVNKAHRMRERGQQLSIDEKRGILLVMLQDTPIGRKKKDTALYRLTSEDSEFTRMALANEFSGEEIGNLGSRPLKEYRPICTVGEITIYEHKDRRDYYVTDHASGSPVTFSSSETDLKRFQKKFYHLYMAYLAQRIVFSSQLTLILFERYNK